ncbi:HlyD family secretion protein [Methylocystis sp. SC2]|uniref:HlyD family secretion protein n=1 Tax=Methylocystis sp. (strain SC2) TaxID=187303 RepID=UPI00027AEFEB|nr:Multidrug resistance protein (HlyD family), EmrA-like [Methylocystis sp. SC2]
MTETRMAPLERGRAESDGPPSSAARRVGFVRRHPALILLGALALIMLGVGGFIYWDYASHFETTDDAFVDARQYSISPKVSGYLTAVEVTDNQHVSPGDVIARIDQRDYRIALADAEAQLAAAQASAKNLDAQIAAQRAQIGASEAQVEQSQAALRFAQQEATRSRTLVQRGTGTVQRQQQTSSQLGQEQARRERAGDTLQAARAQVQSLEAQRATAEARIGQASAQVDKARLDLSYTTVKAAESGRVVRLTAAVGQLVQAGTSLAMFVPDNIWVTANFKETQLDDMRPGQPVQMRIDAYPEREFRGRVVSVQPGSGTAFSLLPAENATGNYVKIVQRVPVKISFSDLPSDVVLGPGMSVVPSIRVRPQLSIYERLRTRL